MVQVIRLVLNFARKVDILQFSGNLNVWHRRRSLTVQPAVQFERRSSSEKGSGVSLFRVLPFHPMMHLPSGFIRSEPWLCLLSHPPILSLWSSPI